MSDRNYIHNNHEQSDNNDQSKSKVNGGEYRNGRLSQIKNSNPHGEELLNEFVSHKDDEK